MCEIVNICDDGTPQSLDVDVDEKYVMDSQNPMLFLILLWDMNVRQGREVEGVLTLRLGGGGNASSGLEDGNW